MGGSRRRRGCAACILVGALFSRQRSFFLYCCDVCLRFRGCPAVLNIELSVSARYQKTRVLLRARRLPLLFVAAESGGVRHKFQNCMPWDWSKITTLGQSESQKTTIFRAPPLWNCLKDCTSIGFPALPFPSFHGKEWMSSVFSFFSFVSVSPWPFTVARGRRWTGSFFIYAGMLSCTDAYVLAYLGFGNPPLEFWWPRIGSAHTRFALRLSTLFTLLSFQSRYIKLFLYVCLSVIFLLSVYPIMMPVLPPSVVTALQ